MTVPVHPPSIPEGALLHYEYKAPNRLRAKWAVPKERTGNAEKCPYCSAPLNERSRDHVFPQFLGGRKWVWSCKPCNDVFGHSIEAAAERQVFTPTYVFLSALGLKHIREGAIWQHAFERDGAAYHLIAHGGTVRERLSRPIIDRDEMGRVVGGTFPDEAAAKAFLKHVEGQGGKVVMERDNEYPKAIPSLFGVIDFGPLVLRPALKMAIAGASLLGISPDLLRDAASDARAPTDEGVLRRCTVVRIDYADIKEYGKPLSHVVYVERSPTRVYAVVQFFGVLQVWCGLSPKPAGTEHAALVGVLDPITGKERFDYTSPLDLPINFDDRIPKAAYSMESLGQWIVNGLQQQSLKRGGKDLKLRLAGQSGQER